MWWVLGGEMNTHRNSDGNENASVYVGNANGYMSMIPPRIGTAAD